MIVRAAFVLACLLAPALAAADCQLPTSLHGRQMTNQSDPLYQPGNPHAGRLVQLEFQHTTYSLAPLGTSQRFAGTYSYSRLAPHVGEIRFTEAFEGGVARYRLLLTCLTGNGGRFVFTQDDGPVPPRQRQNGGTWALTR